MHTYILAVEGDGEDFADRSPSSLLASSVIARKFTVRSTYIQYIHAYIHTY